MGDALIYAGETLWMLAVLAAYIWFFKSITRRFPDG